MTVMQEIEGQPDRSRASAPVGPDRDTHSDRRGNVEDP